MRLVIPAITIKAALSGFDEIGLDREQLLTAAGLEEDAFVDPFATVSNDAYQRMWTAAFHQRADPTLPTQAGLAVPYNEFGILDHLVGTADTIGEAFHILNLFLWLVSVNMTLRFTHEQADWVWVDNDPPEPSRFISEQWTLAVIAQRFRNGFQGFEIEEVHLCHTADVDARLFEQYWRVPVQLGQQHTGFRLRGGMWELGNQYANPMLKETLRTVAEQVEIKQVEDAPLIYAIRTRLPEALESGAFSAKDIAAELGLSKRTLQRRLSAENMTFKELLDVYRQEQALLMLQNGERDMGSIAYALGYNEQSSFNRAFRRWTRYSPSAWLQQKSLDS